MAELLDYDETQESISILRDEISEKLDTLLEKNPDLDIINRPQDLSIFEPFFTTLDNSSTTQSRFIYDAALDGVISDLINLRASENGYNYKQIALLHELSFYLLEKEIVSIWCVLNLIKAVIDELPCQWLLEFWPFFHYRAPYLRSKGLQPNKGPSISLIISINNRIDQLFENNEKNRDFLRSRFLQFTTDIFPTFSTSLINKSFDTNYERHEETFIERRKYREQTTLFDSFWELQTFYQDPYYMFDSSNYSRYQVQNLFDNMKSVFKAIYKAENEKYGPLTDSKKEIDNDNRNSVYHRDDLSEEQKRNLQEFYDSKDFNPTYFVSRDKFNDQLRNDQFFRRTMLQQMLIACSFFDTLCSKITNTNRPQKFKLPNNIASLRSRVSQSLLRDFVSMKAQITELFKSLEKRMMYINIQVFDHTEPYFINQKTFNFTDFTKEYSPFEYNDNLKETFAKRVGFKPRFWATHGTAQISRHWKEPTGLDKLVRENGANWNDEIEAHFSKLRKKISENESKDLNNWKALRMARKNSLFKFKHANEQTGLEGLYDPSIKKAQDEEKKIKETMRLEEEARLKEEKLKQRLEEDAKRAAEEEGEQKKRKASLEEAEESRKKPKTAESEAAVSPEAKSPSEELDY